MVYIIKNVIPFCHCKSYLNISISKFSSLTIFCKCSFDLCQTGKCTSLCVLVYKCFEPFPSAMSEFSRYISNCEHYYIVK